MELIPMIVYHAHMNIHFPKVNVKLKNKKKPYNLKKNKKNLKKKQFKMMGKMGKTFLKRKKITP